MIVPNRLHALANAVNAGRLRLAVEAYEAARVDGLCEDGAYEAAMDAVRRCDATATAGQQTEQAED